MRWRETRRMSKEYELGEVKDLSCLSLMLGAAGSQVIFHTNSHSQVRGCYCTALTPMPVGAEPGRCNLLK